MTGGDDGFLGGSASGVVFGIVLAACVGVVIIGGIKRIAKVTDKLVPFMAVFYVAACLIVLGRQPQRDPRGLRSRSSTAPSRPRASPAASSACSSPACSGRPSPTRPASARPPIAHSAVQTNRPVTEGYVALLEPFIDTVVICTMTALTIVITGVYVGGEGIEGVALTSEAFETVLPWFPNVLAVAVVMFAFSTQLAWSYYGAKATAYLYEREPARRHDLQGASSCSSSSSAPPRRSTSSSASPTR